MSIIFIIILAFLNIAATYHKVPIVNPASSIAIPVHASDSADCTNGAPDTPNVDGQAVHPDVLDFKTAWNGYRYWMGITPYYYQNPKCELLNILASNDGVTWVSPAGMSNPVNRPRRCSDNQAYSCTVNADCPDYGIGETCVAENNADAELFYNSGTLFLYYNYSNVDVNRVNFKASTDGVTWSSETTICDFGAGVNNPISPATAKIGNTIYMFYQAPPQTNSFHYITSTDGVTWDCTPVDIDLTSSIYTLNHIDIIYSPKLGKVFALLPAYVTGVGNNQDQDLLFAEADVADLTSWTLYEQPVIQQNNGQWDDGLYRSAMVYNDNNGQLTIYYSGHSNGGDDQWKIGRVQTTLPKVLNDIKGGCYLK